MILEEPWTEGVRVSYRLDEVLLRKKTRYQDLVIGRNAAYGRCLFLDGLMQSAESDEALYHEPFVHPALVIHGAPKRVLIGGAGEGATAREVLRHPDVQQVVAVDLDGEVVEACRVHLPSWSAGAFDDPRVELRIESIEDTLARAEPGSFDVALLDVTDPVEAGPSVELFTVRFFANLRRVLADDGVVVLQSGPLNLADLTRSRSVLATLGEVFGSVHPMMLQVPSFHGCWSATLAGAEALELSPNDLQLRVAGLKEGCRVYDAQAHRALVHLPPFLREALARGGQVITGDDDARLITVPSGRGAAPGSPDDLG